MDAGTRFAQLSQRFRDLNPWVLDACIGTAFTVFGLVGLFGTTSKTVEYHPVDAFGVVLALGCSLPYFARRRAPVAVLLANVVSLCVLSIIGYPSNVQSQMLLIGMYTVGSHTPSRGRLVGVVGVALGLISVTIAGIPDATSANLLLTGAVYGGAYLFGSTVRNRRLYLSELEARAATHEQEREEEAKRAVADERLRIAQELHDVVAHSMGVIAVQAGVGAHVIDEDPAEAKRSLESIATTSRSTLTEIRRLLGVLRDDGAAGYQPAPGLRDLPRLVADLDATGLPVEVTVEGIREDVPPGVDLTGYRIVQEALTNVLKHAGPARATVTVAYEPGALRLEITDDGRGINGRTTDGGHGLLGMRERVGVYGGTLETGTRPGGGFGVVARLPYGSDGVIRVAVADDQALVRSGFAVLLRSAPDIEVVGEAADGAEAVALVALERPDVILMDIRMPEMDGLDATRHIVDRNPETRVLILTTFDLDEYVFGALRAGASGFLLKDTRPEELLGAVRIIAAGEALLAPSVTQRLIEEFVAEPASATRPDPHPGIADLTTRELEVLAAVARGLSNAEIADELFMAHATAKTHVSRLLTKLDCRDRAQLVVRAYEAGVAVPGGG